MSTRQKFSNILLFLSSYSTYTFLVIMRFASHREIYHDIRQLGIDPFTLMSLTAALFLLKRWHFVDGHFVAKFMTDPVTTSNYKCTSQKSFFRDWNSSQSVSFKPGKPFVSKGNERYDASSNASAFSVLFFFQRR